MHWYQLSFLVHLSELFIWLMNLSILQAEMLRFWSLCSDFCCRTWFLVFTFVWCTYSFWTLFFNLRLFEGVRFLYTQVLVIFLFAMILSWFGTTLSSVISPFLLFIITIAYFYAKFHSYILAVYSYCLFQSL